MPPRRSGVNATLAALLTAACLFGVAAPASAADPAPRRGGILEFAVDTEPPNYDCHANFSFAFIHSVIPHYSTLLKLSSADYPRVEGDLAESWTVSPDRMTYTFHLHPDIRFHDGSKLTSADVAASYQRIIHPPPGVFSARQAEYGAIASIDTPNPTTVVFHLQWPEAVMLQNFASPWNCVYSADKLKAQHSGLRPFRLRRAREGRPLDRPPLGPVFPAGPPVSGRVPGRLPQRRSRHQGDGNRPGDRSVPRLFTGRARSAARSSG
jgi:ABC-type transport system substrate-binding protein